MILAIILVAIYLLSAYLVRRYFQIIYSKGGRWDNCEPDGVEVFFTLFPFANTLFSIVLWSGKSPYSNRDRSFKWFFGLNEKKCPEEIGDKFLKNLEDFKK